MHKFYENKKILITGHTGFKGAWLAQILLNFKSDIVGVSLPPEKSPNLFEILKIENKIKNYFVDIRDYEELKKVFMKEKPEIVFHLAAQAIVRDGYRSSSENYFHECSRNSQYPSGDARSRRSQISRHYNHGQSL